MRIALGIVLVAVLYHFTLSDRSPGMDKESWRMTKAALASWVQ
jgi:hypothetical protein